jgi:phage terminase large subunit-like protein
MAILHGVMKLAKWQYPDETWDNLRCLRLGQQPKDCSHCNPNSIKLVELWKDLQLTKQ